MLVDKICTLGKTFAARIGLKGYELLCLEVEISVIDSSAGRTES